jgi:curli biogenesis system outer membrane secretion channel CsgG
VFDFGSPSNAPDAGMIFANSLGTFLFKSADKDIKILERENLQSILEEMKLGQIGVVSSKTAKEMGRVYGIDVAVIGSVLRYNVDTTSYSDIKTVTYQTQKTEENIAYLNWKARNPSPTKEQLEQAPAPFIHKLVDVEKEYKVSTHKKVAFVTVSFRIVDVNTGENIFVDIIPRSKTVIDGTSAGVQIAGIKHDPLEIPTDTELLQGLTEEVVSELGQKSLQPMKDLEKTYFEIGEKHLLRRNKIKAAESFTDAMFDAKLKQLQKSPIPGKSIKHLEDIFRNYKFEPAE